MLCSRPNENVNIPVEKFKSDNLGHFVGEFITMSKLDWFLANKIDLLIDLYKRVNKVLIS